MADLEPHHFRKPDSDPQKSEKPDPDPHQSQNSGALKAPMGPYRSLDARNRGMKAQNEALECLYASGHKLWGIRIRIK
jgi:hypothetical protein